MNEEKFYEVLKNFAISGTVNTYNILDFCKVLEYLIRRWPYFYEDSDVDCEDIDQLSYFTINRIKAGETIDLILAEYIEYVVDEIIIEIECDDEEYGTNYKKDLGWI